MIVRAHRGFQECAVLEGAMCAFGVYDGVHLGHQFIIDQALTQASECGAPCVVITFAQDPDELFCPERVKKLMTNERRLKTLDACGVNTVLVLPATAPFFALSASDFVQQTFARFTPMALHVGCDFHFGAKAQGNVTYLRECGKTLGFDVCAHELFEMQGAPVTSSRIRALLESCNIAQANELLGRPFLLEGVVETGRQAGRTMGFRTANITIPTNQYALGEGVYAAYATTESGKRYKAAVSVGGAPSFGEAAHANLEAHLIDFDQDIYGQKLVLEFEHFLRPMMIFDSTDELIRTVMGNIQWCRDNL